MRWLRDPWGNLQMLDIHVQEREARLERSITKELVRLLQEYGPEVLNLNLNA